MGVVVSTLPSAAGFVLSGALLPPHSHPVVLEAAYVPGGTALAKQIAQLNLNQHSGGAGAVAATAGPLQMIVGLEMLFEQAAGQFEHWARVPFQRKVRQRMCAPVGSSSPQQIPLDDEPVLLQAVAAAMLSHIDGLAEQAPHLRKEAGMA